MSGPARGRESRACVLRVVSACLALMACGTAPALAQTLTPSMLSPQPGGFVAPQDLPLRKIGIDDDPADSTGDNRLRTNRRGTQDAPAPSRIGQIPEYGLPPASGAAETGYDSLNRAKKKPKYYPGQAKPKPPAGPGRPVPKPAPVNRAGYLRLSVPPSQSATNQPTPPGMPDTPPGQPPRARLPLDTDPFGAVGDYAGSFLIKSAVEVSGGYDTNPGRTSEPHGLPFWVVAPEFLAVSDWERHALVADLRGSFTGYGGDLPPSVAGLVSSAPTDVSRPSFTGHVDGRIDVSQYTQLTSQVRLLVSTDNPGSPNVQAGLARYPIYTTLGGSFGLDQNFNRLDVAVGGTVDRTVYQNSTLTDGSTATNDDRNFNQYGGVGRISYEVSPGLKPFVEAEGDTRVHDVQFDRFGYQRDSDGGYGKAGTSFELTRILTGEISIGYAVRDYVDPRLNRLEGLLTAASLTWTATPLTTAKFYSTTSIDETTLPGTSGVLTRLYTFEVDHDFRRWLTAIGKFTYGTMDYQGDGRTDNVYTIEGDVVYKLTRNFWIKGTLSRSILDSNISGASSASTVAMVGVRAQN